jgi:serine/threonine protein kinase
MASRVGQLLGNYRLLRLLGQGGFSDVYLAEHIHLNTYAAIKILHTQLADDNLESFRTEARTLAHLKHPNIVQVLDFGVIEMTPYLVMQYALNGTLRQRHPRGTPVALNVVISYVKPIAAALQSAHNQRIVHRDVKPENMLVGEQNQLLLSDFGIAVVASSSHQASALFDPAGTAAYMAPELLHGKALAASDQYALATAVYEWLTGALPFHGSYMEIVSQQVSVAPASLREKMPSLSAAVEEVVMIALNKDPQKRFGRIEAFAQALEQAAQVKVDDTKISPQKDTLEVSAMEIALVGPLGRTVLGGTKVTIGRAADNTLVLADAKVSAYHAELRPEGPYYSLVDLSNEYGTFVNEQMVYGGMPRMLQAGDVIRVGDTKFTFLVDTGAQKRDSGQYPAISTPTPENLPSNPDTYRGGIGSSPDNYRGTSSPDNYRGGSSPDNYRGASSSDNYRGNSSPDNFRGGSSPDNFRGNSSPDNYRGGSSPDNYAANPPPSSQLSAYSNANGQMPTYISPHVSAAQQPASQLPQSEGLPPVQPQARQRLSLMQIIAAAVVVLVILAGVIGFFAYHSNQVTQDNATATTVAQQNATATVVRSIDATATTIATSPYPSFTTVVLNDPLTTTNLGWYVNTSCKFATTGYEVDDATQHDFQTCLNSRVYGHIAYQATMVIQKGDCGGLVFGYTSAADFYTFLICTPNTYSVYHYVNGKATNDLAKYSTNPALQKPMNKQNTLAVTLQYNTVDLYFNNTFLESVSDAHLITTRGHVGLLSSDITHPTSVLYNNAFVWAAV